MKLPKSVYSEARSGLGDPERLTVAERVRLGGPRAIAERKRRASNTRAERLLQRAADKALGRRR